MDHTATAAELLEIAVVSQGTRLEGVLGMPTPAHGVVVFAHGSGSSRFSQRNRQVARQLNEAGFATLLFDLLSAVEHARDALTGEYRFDIPLLAQRLVDAIDWVVHQRRTAALPIGLFGASTGAAAALIAAARRPRLVNAVVSRGGRPDLAADALPEVSAPTLLIVGGLDEEVIELNRLAARQLRCEHQLVIVPRAGHLFEETGKLEEVAWLAADWFRSHLDAAGTRPAP